MKIGDIGFIIHKKSALSKTIAWFMKSQWSHCFIIIGELNGVPIICETTDFEIVYSPLTKYTNDPNVMMTIFSNDDLLFGDDVKIFNNTLDIHGKKYGYLQLLSHAVRLLLLRFNVKIESFYNRNWLCYQVVINCLKNTNSDIQYLNKNAIDTQTLFGIVEKKFKQLLWKE